MKDIEVKVSSDRAFVASQYGKEKQYWLNKLSGDWEKSRFPYDYVKKEKKESLIDTEEIKVPDEIASRLIEVGTQRDNRIHMILLAVVVALLEKYTGSSDIILGVPIYKQEGDSQFINTVVVVRNQLAQPDKITFKELLLKVRQTMIEAIDHQNYPIDTLLYQLDISAEEKEFPLFDLVVLLGNIHERKYIDHIHCNVVFSFIRIGERIEGRVEYNSLRYKKSTIQRIVGHFISLLQQSLSDLNIPIHRIDTIPEAEKHQILTEFNQTAFDYPGEKTLHGLFEEQVEKTPLQMAIKGTAGTADLTYRELNKKSNQMARALRKKGLHHGQITGLIGERSRQMAIGILAILKAGGAYLAIDPQLPANRISITLKDTAARFLLIQNTANEIIQKNHVPITLRMNQLEESSRSEPGENLPYTHLNFNPAYVIFTSGSTGKPKGVVIRHKSIVNTLTCRKAEYGMNSSDVSLQLFSPSFDGFLTSFFTPLISGTTIVLLKEEEVKNIEIIKEAIREHKVTHFISVPLLFRGIIENLTPEEASSLKVVTLAGDNTTPAIVEITKQKNKHLEIVNEYGVTEAAVMSTLYRHQERDNEIKIGKPIWNTKIHILNLQQELQPIGVFGELHISGAGVAPGYLNNPELSAEKFNHDNKKLLWGVQGGGFLEKSPPGRRRQKLYKTGDRARWLPDGSIQLAGRIDHQVKIRGNRIELGEIEACLLQHPQIKEVALVVWEDRDSDQPYLCAYFVSAGDLTASQLREYLSGELPDYMIPAYFVKLQTLPRIPGGKILRKSLPDPKEMVNIGRTCEPPANETEKKILQIWAEILGLDAERIGVLDNFFDLGGNSISILKVQSRLSKQFDRDIHMSTMFLGPTIRELAARIYKDTEMNKLENIVKLNKSKRGKNIFIFHPLHGMTYSYKKLAELLEDHCNVYGIQAKGLLHEEPLPQTYEEMLEDYIPQVKAIQKNGPYILAGYCIGAELAYEAARILEDEGQSVEKLVMLDIQAFIPEVTVRFYKLKKNLYHILNLILDFLKKSRKKNSPKDSHQDQLLLKEDELEQEQEHEHEEERLKQRVEANNKILSFKYQYKRIINSPIVHIRAQENHHPGLAKKYWVKMTTGKVDCFETPGDHHTMVAKPHVEKLAEIFKTSI